MSVEFVDTNVLIYAHDGGAGEKHERSVQLLSRLVEDGAGAISIQVLAEFYSAATKKLGIASQEAEEILADLGGWIIHRPGHADLLLDFAKWAREKEGMPLREALIEAGAIR